MLEPVVELEHELEEPELEPLPEPEASDEPEPETSNVRPFPLGGPAFEDSPTRGQGGGRQAPKADDRPPLLRDAAAPQPMTKLADVIGRVETMVAGETPEQRQLATKQTDLVASAHALQVVDADTYQRAVDVLGTLKSMADEVDAFFREDIARANALHKSLTAKRATFLEPLQQAIDGLKRRGVAWFQTEQQRQREEQQRREQAALEQQRQEAARRDAAAEAVAAQGDVETARELRQEAQDLRDAPPMVAPQPPPPKARGAGVRENWTFEVTNKHDFVQAVARGEISLEAVIPNDVYLRARAKADKNTLRWPGVRIFDAGSMAVRGRR